METEGLRFSDAANDLETAASSSNYFDKNRNSPKSIARYLLYKVAEKLYERGKYFIDARRCYGLAKNVL